MKEKIIIGYSIVSPLHLINFLTYLQSCEEDFHEKYLFISNYWDNSIIPQRYIDYCKNKNINVIFDEEEKIIISNKIVKSGLIIHFVCVKNPNLYVLRKSFSKYIEKIIIIDEGLSSYAGFFHSFKSSFREKGVKGVSGFLIYMQITKIIKIFVRHKIDKFTAFHKEDRNPIYKKHFLDILENIGSSHSVKRVEKKSILFCTQPLIEVGLMSYHDYAEMLAKVNDWCRENKISLLIKKHPVDNIFKYSDYNVLDFDGVVEEFVMNQGNVIGVISLCSTSSLLIPACMNKKSYIISFESLNSMDDNLRNLFKKYCEPLEKINDIE